MTNCEQLVDEYSGKFPTITREDHSRIVRGALGGPSPAMTEEGFRQWYDKVGQRLHKHPEILTEIRENPHFIMYRESMILGGDWADAPIIDRVESEAA